MQALLRRPFRLGMAATLVAAIPIVLLLGERAAASVVAGSALVSFLVLVRGSGISAAPTDNRMTRVRSSGASFWLLLDGAGGHAGSDGSGGHDGGGCGGGGGGD